MNTTIHIRPFINSDKAELLTLLQLNTPKYFDQTEFADFRTYLDQEVELYFVVEMNGILIGSGGINFEDDQQIGKISWDLIHPDFQGMGIGAKLLSHRLNILKSMSNIKIIMVRTSQLAYKFYEKNGFELQEIHQDYWAQGFDMYKMIYPLDDLIKDRNC